MRGGTLPPSYPRFNPITRHWVFSNSLIIGEAAAGISEEMRSKYPEIAWRQMSAMRNRLIHGYFEVDLNIVWKTLTTELPPLASQIRKVLANEKKN